MSYYSKLLSIFLLGGLSAHAYAIDGYQDMKFGSSFAQIKAQAKCTLGSPQSVEIGKMYACNDFTFEGISTTANFFFAGDKFIRLGIRVPIDNLADTLNGLSDKYSTSAVPTTEQIEAVRENPNQSVAFQFDKGNIVLYYASDAGGDTSAVLMYSADNAEALQKALGDEIKKDL